MVYWLGVIEDFRRITLDLVKNKLFNQKPLRIHELIPIEIVESFVSLYQLLIYYVYNLL